MRIGIIGAGMIGSTLAKLWVDAGHDVRVASRHPDELKSMVERLGTRASAGTPQDAATFGDVIMLTIPLKAVPDLACVLAPALAGKIVLDTGNAYERRDGAVAHQASAHPQGSAGWAAAMFPGSRWVKAFIPWTSRRCRPRRIAKAIGSASRSPAMMRRRSILQRRWCAMRIRSRPRRLACSGEGLRA